MTNTSLIHLAPYTLPLIISIWVLIHATNRLHARGATVFTVYMLAQAMLITGYVLELASPDLNTKLFWDEVQWLAGAITVATVPIFAVQFTDHKILHAKRIFYASLIAPGTFALLLVFGYSNILIYKNITVLSKPFSQLVYSYMPAAYFIAAYSYAAIAWGIYVLVKKLINPHGLYRSQIIVVIAGILLPVLGSLIPLISGQTAPSIGPIPVTAALGDLAIAWGVFRFRIFEIAPIGRDQVFESLVDPAVILDKRNFIVDINQSMLDLIGQSSDDVIGKPAQDIFKDSLIPIRMFTHLTHAHTEMTFNIGSKDVHYDLTIWPLYNKNREMVGRVYISHDITALKELEGELLKATVTLEERVKQRTQDLTDAYETMLEGLARALEFRDKDTEGHSRRVTENTLKIARRLGISGEELEAIRRGSILHDIGKIGTPDEILHKTGKLNPEERLIVEEHPMMAYKLLSPIKFLEKALEIPYSHHEKWDGTGYPQGLTGSNIPLAARIFAVADVWDALSYDRPYNKAWNRETIIEYFKDQSGKHFDPYIINIFLELIEKGEI